MEIQTGRNIPKLICYLMNDILIDFGTIFVELKEKIP